MTGNLRVKMLTGFPLRPEKLEKWEGIFQSGKKSGNFEQTGKVREKSGKEKLRGFQKKFI